ncbi:hypothetical protein M409DRAFT_50001 [Zasmidium cellare ATCC 36951]|uniref:Uncharacterized protein n=1 Tax=Zasmidium cellare ATCC 36951 TaxID=1080233 RepID=A0A6A6CYW8_ZASCE|nr:uncharacterized protein M409DRAFT_50001 [Zasmidium cellare ATCC 36951]KAF2172281.1 hypothetical protein M409DRAFT_50001 [Zasmidium cellare ATCC 36951]
MFFSRDSPLSIPTLRTPPSTLKMPSTSKKQDLMAPITLAIIAQLVAILSLSKTTVICLPPEITQLLADIVTVPFVCNIPISTCFNGHQSQLADCLPALAYTCRGLYNMCTDAFFSKNNFVFGTDAYRALAIRGVVVNIARQLRRNFGANRLLIHHLVIVRVTAEDDRFGFIDMFDSDITTNLLCRHVISLLSTNCKITTRRQLRIQSVRIIVKLVRDQLLPLCRVVAYDRPESWTCDLAYVTSASP